MAWELILPSFLDPSPDDEAEQVDLRPQKGDSAVLEVVSGR